MVLLDAPACLYAYSFICSKMLFTELFSRHVLCEDLCAHNKNSRIKLICCTYTLTLQHACLIINKHAAGDLENQAANLGEEHVQMVGLNIDVARLGEDALTRGVEIPTEVWRCVQCVYFVCADACMHDAMYCAHAFPCNTCVSVRVE
jgi:hypothetical protein